MVLEEETQQKLEISSEETTRKGKFPFHASEILGNCAFPLSFHREISNEILIFFAVRNAASIDVNCSFISFRFGKFTCC